MAPNQPPPPMVDGFARLALPPHGPHMAVGHSRCRPTLVKTRGPPRAQKLKHGLGHPPKGRAWVWRSSVRARLGSGSPRLGSARLGLGLGSGSARFGLGSVRARLGLGWARLGSARLGLGWARLGSGSARARLGSARLGSGSARARLGLGWAREPFTGTGGNGRQREATGV